MAAGRIQEFFGEDLEEALDSLKSAPGAVGNILVAAVRQIKLVDVLAFAVVVAGWLWVVFGYGVAEDHRAGLLVLSLLPAVLWLTAGAIGGVIFHVGGLGYRSLAYWESYLLIAFFATFGLVSLRLAINPRDRRIYRVPAGPDI